VVNDFRFTSEKIEYPLYRKLGAPESRLGWVGIIRLSGIPNGTESLYRLRFSVSPSVHRIINFCL